MNNNTMKHGVMTVFAAVGMLLATGCGYSKDIKEFPEPWQTLDPGKPPEKLPKIEILEQGGAIIEPGDLVQLHIRDWSPRQNGWREMGDWWLWVGFKSQKETAFFSIELDVAGTTVGLRQGSALRFLEGKEVTKATPQGPVIDRSGQIQLSPSPFGDHRYYSWRKNTQDFLALSELSNSGYFSVLTIKRVCKGPLQYRTVRLFDDGPVRVYTGGLGSHVSHEPSEAWIDEARIEAKCNDGKTAVFQYGPVDSMNGKRWRSPVRAYFDEWFANAWKKLPRGVQFKGNRPPVVPGPLDAVKFWTERETPVRIEFSGQVSDPDDDKISIRFLGQPMNGTLVSNPDGSFTYTPKANWAGIEELTYKASDGLVESDGKSRVLIYVGKPAS